MACLFLILLPLLHQSLLSLASPGPLQVPTSNRVYGPDGPWQAVSVQLGSPGQNLDLYPGGIFSSNILTVKQCQGTSLDPCGSGGLFNPDNSTTIDDTSIKYDLGSNGTSSLSTDGKPVFAYSNETFVLDQLEFQGVTVTNHSISMYSELQMVYPDGNYSLQVGFLSLGPVFNQTFPAAGDNPSINGSLIPGDLLVQNRIPSNSFGLHIGISAVTPKLDLSLWLGGYDAARIVGPVSTQSTNGYDFAIDLLDIGIGVDHGESPFSYSSQQGLLSDGNSSITSNGIGVTIDPTTPYLYLPNSTCTAIAKDLPVIYNGDKALYTWNTTDPQYNKIITSPTYLSFVFRESTGNLTIKAPFQLLNLTLGAPLMPEDTPYFPCQPTQGFRYSYTLGRAFMQAAFVGVNWATTGESEWFLAQAPGPNTFTEPQSRSFTNSEPAGYGQEWADSWKGYWTAIPSPTASSTMMSKTAAAISSHHLAGGAIAGIAIGGAIAAAIVAGICIWRFRRKKGGNPEAVQSIELDQSNKRIPSALQPIELDISNKHIPSHPLLSHHQGTWSDSPGSEIGGRPSTECPVNELSGESYRSLELPGH
ncbi:MAG: hypothetical protein Q9161_002325 [Pseudevernia consocians]